MRNTQKSINKEKQKKTYKAQRNASKRPTTERGLVVYPHL